MRIESSAVNMWCVATNVKKAGTQSFSDFLRPAAGMEARQVNTRGQGKVQPFIPVGITGNRVKINVVTLENGKDEMVGVNGLEKAKMLTIQQVIERLTGKKVRFYAVRNGTREAEPLQVLSLSRGNRGPDQANVQNLTFTSDGVIQTADGRKMDFTVQLNMGREVVEDNSPAVDEGTRPTDPLVINFDAGAAGLTESKFVFDIDFDGNSEEIPFLTGGSGFLAVDLNSDGLVNDGSELFGPRSGNGFLDLAVYDADGNNWIDENDSIYEKLRIWTKDTDGRDTLFALGVKGIGALYLGNVVSDYDMSDPSKGIGAAVTQTGIFLREDGTAGTVQDLNFWV